jgi:hypothetical protein
MLDVYTKESTKEIFEILERCHSIQQDPKYHPEGDVLNHSLQTAQWAFRETNDIDLILAALLHDVGKIIESYGHEKIGCELLKGHVSTKTLFLIEHHMRIWAYINGEMKKLSSCIFLANHPWLPELIQLARFDKKGRNPNKNLEFVPNDIIDRLNKATQNHFSVPLNFESIKNAY